MSCLTDAGIELLTQDKLEFKSSKPIDPDIAGGVMNGLFGPAAGIITYANQKEKNKRNMEFDAHVTALNATVQIRANRIYEAYERIDAVLMRKPESGWKEKKKEIAKSRAYEEKLKEVQLKMQKEKAEQSIMELNKKADSLMRICILIVVVLLIISACVS